MDGSVLRPEPRSERRGRAQAIPRCALVCVGCPGRPVQQLDEQSKLEVGPEVLDQRDPIARGRPQRNALNDEGPSGLGKRGPTTVDRDEQSVAPLETGAQ